MTTDKPAGSFTKLPNKIFQLGLDAFEIAAFAALASHGGENAQGIFPSLPRLVEMTGMSRRKLWDALDSLARCNVIQWERGKKGVANTYYILGVGAWSPKVIHATPATYPQRGASSAPGALPVVHGAHSSSAPGALPVVHGAHPNQTQLNQTQLTREKPAFNFGDNSEWDESRVQKEKARQIAALAAAATKSPR